MMARTWAATAARSGASPPQRLAAKTSARKAAEAAAMKANSGTILAMVAMVFSAAACWTPRSTRQVDAPQQRRTCQHRGWGRAVAEDREEAAQCRLDQHQAGELGEAAGGPVAERRGEAEVVAEAGLGVRVDAGVEVGPPPRQGLEDERQHQHARAGDAPGDDCPDRPAGGAELRRQGEDAGADHRADDQRDQRGEGELLVRGRGGCRR